MTPRPGRALWLNPAMGVAGDMVAAALIGAGADVAFVRSQLDRLDLPGWTLGVSTATRSGLVATRFDVSAPDGDHHRPWSHIDKRLADADLDPAVSDGARATFRRLAEAEAAVHGIDVDEVEFHEVGAVDAIIDIVGAWAALTSIRPEVVHCGPVGLGTGTAATAHGRIPVPAPATLELLRGAPVVAVDLDAETATPTGAALLVTMVDRWGPVPSGTIESTGRGAGAMDPPSHANVVTAVVIAVAARGPERHVVSTMIETNVDDVSPEVIGHVIDRALQLGADDAWVVPITMKKSRPAHQIRVLCAGDRTTEIRHMLEVETGTLGLRQWSVDKVELERRTDEVVVEGHRVRIKVGRHGAKPEHDDVVRVSDSVGRPLRDVARDALDRWSRRTESVDGTPCDGPSGAT